MKYNCFYCGKEAEQAAGAVNRARKSGHNLFCGRACSGLAKRDGKTKEQRIADKAAYDAEYREKNRALLKAKKAEYFRRTYDPAKAAVDRKKIMPRHVEYCRRPEYRAWKRDYDRQYRAEQEYGEFAECFLLVMDIRTECLSQMTDYEIRYAKGGVGKTQQRKRAYERTLREELEVGTLGNLEQGKGWSNGSLASGLRRLTGAGNLANNEYSAPRLSASKAARVGGRDHLRRNVKATSSLPRNGSHALDVDKGRQS